MQEEVEMRTVTMAFHASKFSGRVMKNGIAKLLHAMRGKLTVPHGKQSVRQLARQNQGIRQLTEGEEITETLPADPDVKNYSYTIVDGEVYFRENSVMMRPKLNRTAQERVKSMVALRDTVYRLMNAQLEDADDKTIENEQRELNRQYDAFSSKFGLINDRANRLAFSDDSSYYLLSSLEVLDEDRKLERKADMFTKRTIRRPQAITHTDTAAEALAVSIGEKARVDLPYMAELTGKNEDAITKELTGVIYLILNPKHGRRQTNIFPAMCGKNSGQRRLRQKRIWFLCRTSMRCKPCSPKILTLRRSTFALAQHGFRRRTSMRSCMNCFLHRNT